MEFKDLNQIQIIFEDEKFVAAQLLTHNPNNLDDPHISIVPLSFEDYKKIMEFFRNFLRNKEIEDDKNEKREIKIKDKQPLITFNPQFKKDF